MGRTGAYTMLETGDDEYGVPITDKEAFEEHIEEVELEPITQWEYESESTYPRVEQLVLYGFIPSSVEGNYRYFVKNLHIERDEGKFRDFWERVAEYTEPFVFYHGGADGHFPDLADYVIRTGVSFDLYRIHSNQQGGVFVESVDFSPDKPYTELPF